MRTGALSPFMHPAKLVSYDADNRTASVTIAGLTDGVDGIPAMLAYPIGDDDLDTERELLPGADVWVFFEQGDTTKPVIAFYRRHGQGRAITKIRRIRQETIELIARSVLNLFGLDKVNIEGDTVNIKASTLFIDADIVHSGDSHQLGDASIAGSVSATNTISSSTDVIAAGVSGKGHSHGGDSGGSTSSPR